MATTASKQRRFCITPNWFVLLLPVITGLLWLAERFEWFRLYRHKGWPVLAAIAVVGAFAILLLTWGIAAWLLRFRFRLSLRSFIVFCVAAALVSDWLAAEVRDARRQEQIVSWIGSFRATGSGESRNGHAEYAGYDGPEGEPAPLPLLELMGVDFFQDAAFVSLDQCGDFQDKDLSRLYVLKRLRWLYLDGTSITDVGTAGLKCFAQLERLDLSSTKITDDGLGTIGNLPRLEILDVSGTAITDRGIENIRRIKTLFDFFANQTRITDSGLERLSGMPTLASIWLADTQITDTGIQQFKPVSDFRYFMLDGTQITDTGLESLARFKQLRWLGVRRTRVTASGIARLKTALPKCKIDH